mmetsp:Transcript_32126/g.82261  ORF Transcript_32126/g.82261 Transcript_32126/m.82261 type:complete len:224 (-) Transcript_32126:553-1224(-)
MLIVYPEERQLPGQQAVDVLRQVEGVRVVAGDRLVEVVVPRGQHVAGVRLLVGGEAVHVHLAAHLQRKHDGVVAAHGLLAAKGADRQALEAVLEGLVELVRPGHKLGRHHHHLAVGVLHPQLLEGALPPQLLCKDAVLIFGGVDGGVKQLKQHQRGAVAAPVPVVVLPEDALPMLPLHQQLQPRAVQRLVRRAGSHLPLESRHGRLVEAVNHVVVVDVRPVLM